MYLPTLSFRVTWLPFCSRDELIEKGNANAASIWLESWTAMKSVMKVQTFQVIVLQGIVGSLPWTAMVFFTMWFELIGKHDHRFLYLLVFYTHISIRSENSVLQSSP